MIAAQGWYTVPRIMSELSKIIACCGVRSNVCKKTHTIDGDNYRKNIESKKGKSMAIAGFLVHTLPEHAQRVETSLQHIAEISTYGIFQQTHIVAVVETTPEKMEEISDRIHAIEGVLALYLTSFTTEDETVEAV